VFGGIAVKFDTGPFGLPIDISGTVTIEYVFAPPAVSVIEFDDLLNACEHSELLLICPVNEGGGTIEEFTTARFVHPDTLVAITV